VTINIGWPELFILLACWPILRAVADMISAELYDRRQTRRIWREMENREKRKGIIM
jgi:hypothetical protein